MKDKIIEAINKGINNALIRFEEPNFKKSNNVSEISKELLWIENNTVDLGLPSGTRWATCNIGAEKPTDYGLYFLWGCLVGYANVSNKKFNEKNYGWYDVNEDNYTKYNEIDKQTELDLEDDPAYEYSNSMLVSPTVELCKELYESCDWIWTTINGINGYKIQNKDNDNYIFLPASGYSDRLMFGRYWSKSLYSDNIAGAYFISFNPNFILPVAIDRRFYGFTVRGVLL